MLQYLINSSPPGQIGRHLADDIFKYIVLNENVWNVWIFKKIWLMFVPNDPIDNNSALVQVMAWRRPGDKPWSEPMMVHFTGACMRYSASMS